MTCKMCKERGQTWEGSAPRCAFEGVAFSSDNWNCATMNALRELVDDGKVPAAGVAWLPDETCAVIPYEGDENSGFIVMTWYKRRGQTGAAMLMYDDSAPVPITEAMALEAIAWYAKERVVL